MSLTPRQPLTRAGIISAGIELADVNGLGPLTMRNLAAHLGFEVMSLYNHVASKGDLLDGMLDAVASEIEEPPCDLPWKPAARLIAMSAHDVLLRHHWAPPLLPTRWPGPSRWHHMETLLRVLGQAGLDADRTDLGFHAITLHVQGSAQQEVGYTTSADFIDAAFDRLEAQVDELQHPNVYAHVQFHRRVARDRREFEFVLDLILDGLEQSPSGSDTVSER